MTDFVVVIENYDWDVGASEVDGGAEAGGASARDDDWVALRGGAILVATALVGVERRGEYGVHRWMVPISLAL